MKHVALIIPLNSQNKILLQHKGTDAPNNPDMWCLFGGSIEQGESPEEAARREFFEELGVTINKPAFFQKREDKEKNIERSYFVIPLDVSAETLGSQQQEGDDLGFFSLEEMKTLRMNQAHLHILIEFFRMQPTTT